MSKLKFLLFADFHYKKKMYPATVRELALIMKRAKESGADLVIHAGDFCNDYTGSPELIRAYLDNAEGFSVFGCYGNHELESKGNSMSAVTPLLSNRPDKLVFGTEDGKIGDGRVGYYYTDICGYRFVFLDTNYSLSPSGEYEHNRTASWGKPKENTRGDSLGDAQLAWLEDTLSDAADRSLACVTVSHASFSGVWRSSPDAERVRAIFRSANEKRAGTVRMAINGHYHTSNTATVDGVFYLDCPAAINGWWQSERFYPYAEEDADNPRYTFKFEDYDEQGNPTGVFDMPYSKLTMGAQSLFYEQPVSAIVTLAGGEPRVELSETRFAYGITLPES